MENDYILEKLRPFFSNYSFVPWKTWRSRSKHIMVCSLFIFSLGVPEALHVRDVRNVSMYYMSSCTKRLHVRNVFVYETLHVRDVRNVFMYYMSSCRKSLHVRNVFMYETCETSSCMKRALF